MRIEPINYRTRVHKISSKPRQVSELDAQSRLSLDDGVATMTKDESPTLLHSEPTVEGDGEDQSREDWIKELPDYEDMNASDISEYVIDYTNDIQKLYSFISNGGDGFEPNRILSFQHKTLPEAILLCELMTHSHSSGSYHFACQMLKSQSNPQKLCYGVSLKYDSECVLKLKLIYEPSLNSVIIYDDSHQKIGWVKYHMRQQRLEEIEGVYKKQRLFLDPIWQNGQRISSERIQIGQFQTDLIKQFDQKHASIFKNGQKVPFSVEDLKTTLLKPGFYQTVKTSNVGSVRFQSSLIFGNQLLLPVYCYISFDLVQDGLF